MSDFNPSVDAAKAALGDPTLEHRAHPGGSKGSAISLAEVAKRAWKGRNDPRVIAWARRAIHDAGAGGPGRTLEKASAILAALRKETSYVNDPTNTEFMAGAPLVLCLDDKGLCFRGGDCDELTLTYVAAAMSAGLTTRVVGQAFDGETAASHVLAAVQDPETKRWHRVDPSTDKPVGEYIPASREWWIDPMQEAGAPVGVAGDFVGIGDPQPGRVGALTPEQRQTAVATVTAQVELATTTVQRSLTALSNALVQLGRTRELLRPATPFDPEPATPITSLADFPTDGTWTQSMAAICAQIWRLASMLVAAGQQALNGARTTYVDAQKGAIVIGALAEDTWHLRPIAETTNTILGIFSPVGAVLGGIVARDGKALSKTEVEQEIARTTPQGVGAIDMNLAAVVTLAAGFAGLSVYYVISKLCDMASTYTREATYREIAQCVASGKCTAEQGKEVLDAIQKDREAEIRARQEEAKNDPFTAAGSTIMWLALGGATIAGAIALAPIIKAAASRFERR